MHAPRCLFARKLNETKFWWCVRPSLHQANLQWEAKIEATGEVRTAGGLFGHLSLGWAASARWASATPSMGHGNTEEAKSPDGSEGRSGEPRGRSSLRAGAVRSAARLSSEGGAQAKLCVTAPGRRTKQEEDTQARPRDVANGPVARLAPEPSKHAAKRLPWRLPRARVSRVRTGPFGMVGGTDDADGEEGAVLSVWMNEVVPWNLCAGLCISLLRPCCACALFTPTCRLRNISFLPRFPRSRWRYHPWSR